MSRVTVKRRPDGIVQIQRQRAWRAFAGPIPAAVLGLTLLALLAIGSLAVLLVLHPTLLLLIGGLAVLVLAGARYALHEPAPAPQEHASRPRRGPPLDAA